MQVKAETAWIELWQGSNEFKNVPHTHENWMQITLPVKGVCHFTQEARSYALGQGSGLIQPPGMKHHFHLGEQASVIILKVQERGLGGMTAIHPPFIAGAQQDVLQAFNPPALVSRFQHWMLSLMQGQTLSDPLAVQQVEHDVLAFLGDWLGISRSEPAQSALPEGITDPHMLRTLEYLHDCYEQAICVDELAAQALQSRFHFIRSFRKATGTTPYQYLLSLRIQEAMRRLRRTEVSIGGISADLGFSSTSQFHRAFLRATGVTPQQYRQG
ncbi:helix-turn-helix domain-containing protein [Paenibacillus hexagrammi]|uniref:AraC family transcriptional regulator n=1 Tax=Paenibacillus hexagrammi TaxID=2908839 RepID=A0ABY3SP95_9BACL|nr:AraC family transcriptional regulator [Paenibacillus sp. YPD9-1]UJF34960.1 AraC family transcriptional regulator [Paenibacillus sp. YPD9-1]